MPSIKRYCYSLRIVLVLQFIVGATCGAFVLYVRSMESQWKKEQVVLDRVASHLRGQAETDAIGPSWVRFFTSDGDLPRKTTKVWIWRAEATDRDLSELCTLKDLEELHIASGSFSDSSLSHISQLRRLKSLRIPVRKDCEHFDQYIASLSLDNLELVRY